MAHPMGPLQLADFIGLDVCLSILRVLHEGLGNGQIRTVSAVGQHGHRRTPRRQERPRVLRTHPGSKDLVVAPNFR